ncbi:hypothetical protein M2432_001680 [Mycobacterium sp. OTB74]|nr:hypothetical protein [Mycobacterium sp. OTB74]
MHLRAYRFVINSVEQGRVISYEEFGGTQIIWPLR